MARRFEFRLEALRTVRVRRRDDYRRALAERLRELAACRRRSERCEQLVQETHDELRRLLGGTAEGKRDAGSEATIELPAVRFGCLHLNQLQELVLDSAARRTQIEAEVRDAQAVLAEATKLVKALDKLEERQRRRFDEEVGRRERAEQDELATQRVFASRRDAMPGLSGGPPGMLGAKAPGMKPTAGGADAQRTWK